MAHEELTQAFEALATTVVEANADHQQEFARLNGEIFCSSVDLSERPELAEALSAAAQWATMSTLGALIEAGQLQSLFDVEATKQALKRNHTIEAGNNAA